MPRPLFICLLILFSGSVNSADQRIDPLVRIRQGLVRGLLGKHGLYGYFLGIPYAEVDHDNPFGDAKPPPSFGDNIFEATTHVICPQRLESTSGLEVSLNMTHDCLKLNIYTPDEATTSNLLPVLIWIHGGKFMFGSGASYDPEYFMDKGIVVVTVNYRLGPYGFLCLDSHKVPGNQGLKDQHLAFQWVKDNIAAFGGNPNEITINGQEAGATSALLHLYADTEKLFSRIIVQSGTPLSVEHFYQADLDAAMKVAEYLRYNVKDTESALLELAQESHDNVINAFFELGIELGPCKERSFSGIKNYVNSYPFFLSNENNVRNTPVLIGHTSKEEEGGTYFIDEYFDGDPFYDRIKGNFNFNDERMFAEASEYVRLYYIGDGDITTNISSKLIDFESDFRMNYPIQNMITNLLNENAGPIYQYVFSYVNSNSSEAAKHSDELKFLFKTSQSISDQEEQRMMEHMTTLWVNFVKHGNPTPSTTELLPVQWQPITRTQRPYLDLNQELSQKNRIYHDRMAFWEIFYRLYGKYHRLAKECNL